MESKWKRILVYPGYFKLKLWGAEGRIQSIYCRQKCNQASLVRLPSPKQAGLGMAVLVVLQDKHHLPSVKPRSLQLFCRAVHLTLLGAVNLFRAFLGAYRWPLFQNFLWLTLRREVLCVYVYYRYRHICIHTVSEATFAQAALGGKRINRSVCCEQVSTIGNFITQDFSCVSQ